MIWTLDVLMIIFCFVKVYMTKIQQFYIFIYIRKSLALIVKWLINS